MLLALWIHFGSAVHGEIGKAENSAMFRLRLQPQQRRSTPCYATYWQIIRELDNLPLPRLRVCAVCVVVKGSITLSKTFTYIHISFIYSCSVYFYLPEYIGFSSGRLTSTLNSDNFNLRNHTHSTTSDL